ncbi:anti-sigma factor antagonist [Rhodophyticola sp. CCM32]|uniref:STAS domain-containing protein n=1 Tax=Rhodophyticola sp. CCM32 TaxID=2916397 RepID=UPI00107FB538|nr:STAS domain-containing protein [Rhodophyticola sp. CCM32]QBY01854.1 anti-sigma factor antagonist [Rhodophyticola sp. CCM32]
MNLVRETAGPITIIHVEEDRIDASVAIQFKDSFRALIEDDTGPVVLNLGKVNFLDSSGLGALVAARKLLGAGRVLDLAGLQPTVTKVMTLTRMNTVFNIHEDVPQAVAAHGATLSAG